jgi:ribosomal protein L18
VDIEQIKDKIARGRYAVAFTHTEKLRRRRIRLADIEQAAETGMIIEEYPTDPRGASCLIFGLAGVRPLHLVRGRLEAEEILIITAYEPDLTEWEDDWKTRKKK